MGFKSLIERMDRMIRQKEKELEKSVQAESRSRKIWTKGYQTFVAASETLAKLNNMGTKTAEQLKAKIRGWGSKSEELTEERNDFRSQMKARQDELVALRVELAKLNERLEGEGKEIDEIVTNVFALNEVVVRASVDREECLKRHVFPRLIDEQGNLRSQITFDSKDGLRRVVAMVNTMTIVRGDLAREAKDLVQKFFDRFEQTAAMEENMKMLYELTRKLLIEKTEFKVGPDLYRFIGMELDVGTFPELVQAQTLLRNSIRSEKTNSYIRIYKRASSTDNWESVRQS